ncbi:MAG: helicase associated domain-containing protein, partial [Acidimicrobiales bacterium]
DKDRTRRLAGRWVANQRADYNKKTLSPERIEALNRVKGWTWDPTGDIWYEMLEETEGYLRTDGRVPSQTDKDPQKAKAGRWASKQRQCHSRGTLPQDRFAALDALDGWWWTKP